MQRLEREQEIKAARQLQAEQKSEESKRSQEQAEKQKAEDKIKSDFFDKLEKSTDLHENLEELTNFLQKNSGATGVYIGKLEYPMRAIADDAGEQDHLD